MRLKNRKYGRTVETIPGGTSTHIVKIGFDARGPSGTTPVPGKYNGFVICRDRVGPDNNLIVDHAIMKRLDPSWGAEKLLAAKREQLKAEDDLLPKTLHFVLIGDAQKDGDGEWHYPRTFSESLEWWGKMGLMCIGNGDTAIRTQDDRTKRKIQCVPVGREHPEEKTCPYSVPRMQKSSNGKEYKVVDCKSHSRLTLCLYVDVNGKPEPLCRELGWNGRYRFDTSSGYNPLRILAELDEAARRCEGRIHLIRGTLSFGMQRKRYDGGVSIVGQVMFSLSEEDVARREQDIHREKMEREGRLLSTERAPRPSLMLSAEIPEVPTVDPEEELRAAADAAQGAEPPWPQEAEQGEVEDEHGPLPETDQYEEHDGPLTDLARTDLNVDAATPQQLVASLEAFIGLVAKEEGADFTPVFQRMTSFDGIDGRKIVPRAPGSFLATSPTWPNEQRIADLRTICREYAENDPRFAIIDSLQPVVAG